MQKERKAQKEVRREKKDKRKAAEWAAKGDQEAIGPVEAFRREKKRSKEDDEDEEEEKACFDVEYKALKKEVKEERAAKKGKKETASAGMFDDLD